MVEVGRKGKKVRCACLREKYECLGIRVEQGIKVVYAREKYATSLKVNVKGEVLYIIWPRIPQVIFAANGTLSASPTILFFGQNNQRLERMTFLEFSHKVKGFAGQQKGLVGAKKKIQLFYLVY